MGNFRLKQQKDNSKKNASSDSRKPLPGKAFVLSDVTKDELNKRRIPVYSSIL